MNQARIGSTLRLGLALCAGLAVCACEREDAAGDALNRAHIKLTSLSPYGASLPSSDTKVKTYNDVISSLKGVSSTGTPMQAASASLLTAQAQMGLAEPSAALAGELDRQVFNLLTSARSALGHHQAYSSRAEGAAAFDPSKELAAIEAADKERAEQITKEEATRATIQKKVTDLQTKARGKADEARARRQQSGSLRQKVVTQTATQGEKTLLEARELSRQADAFDVEASKLEAEAAKVAPEAIEVQNTIDRLTKQRELLAKERGDVGRRTQAAKEQASQLKAEAAKAADEIKKVMTQIHDLRAGELADATKSAVDGFTLAAGTAGKAVTEMKGAAQLIVGSAKHSLGDVHLGTVRGLQVYGLVLESLATAKYPLPDAEAYKSRLEETKTAIKESQDAAFEAYQGADAAYGAVGGTGETKNKLIRLNAAFRELVKASGGNADELIPSRGEVEPPAAPEAAPATPEGAATATGTPQETLQALASAAQAGRFDEMADLFLTTTPETERLAAATRSMGQAMTKFTTVVKGKFGDAMGDAILTGLKAGAGGSMAGFDASSANVEINGDTAQVTVPGQPQPMVLKLHEGKWKIDPASQGPDQVQTGTRMMEAIGKILTELTADVESGKIATMEQLGAQMQARMMSVLTGGGG